MLYDYLNLRHLITVVLMLIVVGCNDYGTNCPPGEYCDCPSPYDNSFGPYIPEHWHTDQKLSPDGRTLGFLTGSVTLRLLDLQSGQIQTIDVWNRLPKNVQLMGCANYAWCPYDNNRLLLHCVTLTDTIGDGKHYQYGHNLYITNVDGSEFQRVTPTAYGMAGAVEGIGITDWLRGSVPDRDSIHMGVGLGIFIPQQDIFVPDHYSSEYIYFYRQSRTGNYVSLQNVPQTEPYKMYVNQMLLPFPSGKAIGLLEYASWSPDGRKLALSVTPKTNGKAYEQVWIVDVERFLREKPMVLTVEVIDFQRKFCTYNRWGSYAEFITDSTLAVSMHGDLEAMSALWEITLDGRKKRQLTFAP